MGKPVVYRNGLYLNGLYCVRCRRKRSGFIMQNRIRWVAYLTCGHMPVKGSVLPVEALEAMKLANQKQSEDPRAKQRAQFEADERRKKEMDKIKSEMSKLNRTRQRYI